MIDETIQISATATVRVYASDTPNNLKLELRKNGKMGEVTINVGDVSQALSPSQGRKVEVAGIDPATRRVYVGAWEQGMYLPLDTCARIDAISLKSKQDSVEREQTYKLQLSDIEGLTHLRAALHERERYHYQFERMMEDEDNDGVNPPRPVTTDLDSLKVKFPRAWAYIRAEDMSLAANDSKASEGKRAVQEILAGAGPEALSAAEKRWSDYATEHVD